MKIIYKCKCMENETSIDVPDRRPGTDVVNWMQNCVQLNISYDHAQLFPNCRLKITEYVKIPVADKNIPIGMQPTKQ